MQELMTETLSYLLQKMHPERRHQLAHCLLSLRELRTLSSVFRKMEHKFVMMWGDKIDIPPLFREMWSPCSPVYDL